jgi:hypothetical protein
MRLPPCQRDAGIPSGTQAFLIQAAFELQTKNPEQQIAIPGYI